MKLIILPKPEPTCMTPVCDEDLYIYDSRNIVHFTKICSKTKLISYNIINETVNNTCRNEMP